MLAVGISFSGSNKIWSPPFPCPIVKITQSVFTVARGECKDNGLTAQRDAHGAEFAKHIYFFNVRHAAAEGLAARTLKREAFACLVFFLSFLSLPLPGREDEPR